MPIRILSPAFTICLLLVALSSACAKTSGAPELIDDRAKPQRATVSKARVRSAFNEPLKNPRIVVSKASRRLDLYSDDVVVRSYRIGLGTNPVDDKRVEGDGCTPEGEFYIFTKNEKSAYYLSLGLSYPNAEDAERGLREQIITRAEYRAIRKAIVQKKAPPQRTRLGGLIYIHGNGSRTDWTLGCVALENEDMDELFKAVAVGTPVVIRQ